MNIHDTPAPAASSPEALTVTWDGFWNPRRVNPLRSFVFLGVGTIVGLAIAGYGLFTAKGTVTHSVPSEDLALINQRPILRTDFTLHIMRAPSHHSHGESREIYR